MGANNAPQDLAFLRTLCRGLITAAHMAVQEETMPTLPPDPYQLGEVCGKRAVWVSLLAQALDHLGYDGPPSPFRERLSYILEREAAIARLREICGAWGDNDWPDHLALADILERHLLPHLERGMVNDG